MPAEHFRDTGTFQGYWSSDNVGELSSKLLIYHPRIIQGKEKGWLVAPLRASQPSDHGATRPESRDATRNRLRLGGRSCRGIRDFCVFPPVFTYSRRHVPGKLCCLADSDTHCTVMASFSVKPLSVHLYLTDKILVLSLNVQT